MTQAQNENVIYFIARVFHHFDLIFFSNILMFFISYLFDFTQLFGVTVS